MAGDQYGSRPCFSIKATEKNGWHGRAGYPSTTNRSDAGWLTRFAKVNGISEVFGWDGKIDIVPNEKSCPQGGPPAASPATAQLLAALPPCGCGLPLAGRQGAVGKKAQGSGRITFFAAGIKRNAGIAATWVQGPNLNQRTDGPPIHCGAFRALLGLEIARILKDVSSRLRRKLHHSRASYEEREKNATRKHPMFDYYICI